MCLKSDVCVVCFNAALSRFSGRGALRPWASGLAVPAWRVLCSPFAHPSSGQLGFGGRSLDLWNKEREHLGSGAAITVWAHLMKKAITRMQSRAHLGSGGWSGDDVDELWLGWMRGRRASSRIEIAARGRDDVAELRRLRRAAFVARKAPSKLWRRLHSRVGRLFTANVDPAVWEALGQRCAVSSEQWRDFVALWARTHLPLFDERANPNVLERRNLSNRLIELDRALGRCGIFGPRRLRNGLRLRQRGQEEHRGIHRLSQSLLYLSSSGQSRRPQG